MLLQRPRQRLQHDRIVVDQEDTGRGCRLFRLGLVFGGLFQDELENERLEIRPRVWTLVDVVGVESLAALFRGVIGLRGQDDDRKRWELPVSEPFDHFEAFDVRQGEIEDEEVGSFLSHLDDTPQTVLRSLHPQTEMAATQREIVANDRIVVDDDDGLALEAGPAPWS